MLQEIEALLGPPPPFVRVAGGDDCAIVHAPSAEEEEILTTDLLVEGTHYLCNSSTNWTSLGRKAIVASISDVASMGAQPRAVLVSLALPRDASLRMVRELYSGMVVETAKYGAAIVGGDTAFSPTMTINIAITATRSRTSSPMLRSACAISDFVYVSGNLGASRVGLRLLLEKDFLHLRQAAYAQALVNRHLCPEPRLALGQLLASLQMRIACIDISDSLFNELHLLSESSRVGFEIVTDSIPASAELHSFCAGTNEPLHDYTLFSGEEYELLFTCELSPEELQRFLEERQVTTPVTCVGKVTEGREVRFMKNGSPIQLTDLTFKHFRPNATSSSSSSSS